jgi:hypothetical protein
MQAVLVVMLLVGICHSFYRLMVNFWRRDDYNYCYLIPFVFFYMIWARRKDFFFRPSEPTWKGFFLIVPEILF